MSKGSERRIVIWGIILKRRRSEVLCDSYEKQEKKLSLLLGMRF
jgi:hypothetical protein